MFHIALEQGSSFSTMLAVALGAIVLAGVFYYRAFRSLKPVQWQLLFGLRVVAILLVVLLLFRPVFSYHRDLQERPSLVFLVDRSGSMSIADDATGVTRFNQARRQAESWAEALRGDFNLHWFSFAEQAEPLDGVEQLAGMSPDGQVTSFIAGLQSASKAVPPRDMEAILLVSDGVHNAAGDPVAAAARLGATVHTIGVGASLRSDVTYRDIRVVGLNCPERMIRDNLAEITALVEGVGLAGRVVRVILDEDGQVLDEQELTLAQPAGGQEVRFEFRPSAVGRRAYTVRVPPAPEERIEENNRRSAVALVVEPGIRVLYIEGTLRAEYGALVDRFLAKDPDLEFCALVQTRPNVFLRRGNISDIAFDAIPTDQEAFDQFDVFILGDLDSSFLRPAQQAMIARRIRAGAGLVMLGGYNSLGPGGYAGTELGELLPVRLGSRDIGQITEPFLPVLSPEGVRHPIFANIVNFFPSRSAEARESGLPLLDGCTRVEGPKPTATVLATLTAEEDAMPVLAVHPVDKGRVAVFCGDTTRKWQQGPRALGQDSPFLQFWGQMVRWLAGRSEEVAPGAAVVASADKGYYQPGELIRLSAIVRDTRGEGTDKAAVHANVTGPAGRPERAVLASIPGPGGHYAGDFEPQAPGTYEFEVEARVGDETVKAEKLAVEVGRPNLEFENLNLDERTLGRIAAETGGRYFHITTADRLTEEFDRSVRSRRVVVERQLYWPPLFWTLFLGVITTEWVLRKRFQLR
ncbi:MAG: glutamine amidotransferase [Thermoguttaceae bacterium]|jgi:uncharacterized membrane protein|nr:glutamine amidotransferase [Thermoguttaceae bacterium]